jgi:solute carrier family 25 iron transporter 28/37
MDDLEWEEWNKNELPFTHHCIAGSIAGVSEHVLLYPIDTVKTHMQSFCKKCPVNEKNVLKGSTSVLPSSSNSQPGMLRTIENLMNQTNARMNNRMLNVMSLETAASMNMNSFHFGGFKRLWRGAQTVLVGCIPAHALYFSVYEETKQSFSGHTTFASALAGALATISHDTIMAPIDTLKQRLQLGHYNGFSSALKHIYTQEGLSSLYRSFPITLFSNVPYGIIMVVSNDFVKENLHRRQLLNNAENVPTNSYSLQTCLISGSVAGALASAITTPLDRVKTRLQTQALGAIIPPECEGHSKSCPKKQLTAVPLRYDGFRDAFRSIIQEEGAIGLFRGLVPRLVTHTPAVAISWTAYEMAKKWLASF